MMYAAQPKVTIGLTCITWVDTEYSRKPIIGQIQNLTYVSSESINKLLIGKSSPNGRNSYLDEDFDEIFQGVKWFSKFKEVRHCSVLVVAYSKY